MNMPTFTVSARGSGSAEVSAVNWIAALGEAVASLGDADALERLACERLPNGTVIARDIATGSSFIVVPQLEEDELEPLIVEPIDSVDDELQLDALEGATSAHDACQCALQLAQELTPAESGAVLLLDRGMLRFTAVVGPESHKLDGVRLPRDTGIAGYVVDQRQSVVLRQASRDRRHCGEVDALTGYRTEDLVAVPVVSGRRIHGVLELMNLPADQDFPQRVIDQLEALGAALGERLQEITS
ncbi:MAG: GAF domain-containing protein [Deltaproteobacteria bacterium]|nr:MAG: GAF domain-containing protein [Deltaproteobacteria bacterium]